MAQDVINTEKNLMTIDNVADFFSIDRVTVWKWRKQGRLKAYGMGRRVYFKRSEVVAALVELKPREA